MKKYKELGIYDFSDYAEEITGTTQTPEQNSAATAIFSISR